MAGDKHFDEIVDIRPRRRMDRSGRPNINAEDLRPSRLLTELPDFISQLAQANLKLEAEAAKARATNERPSFRAELDEEEADENEHISVDVFAGVLEEKKSPKITAKKTSSDDEGESNTDFQGSASRITLNPATKRKHIISNKGFNFHRAKKVDGDRSMQYRIVKPKQAPSTASTSSSEPDTTSDEDDSEIEKSDEIRSDAGGIDEQMNQPSDRVGNSSDSVSQQAHSRGTRLESGTCGFSNIAAGPQKNTNTASPGLPLRIPTSASVPNRHFLQESSDRKPAMIEEVSENDEAQ